MKTVSLQIAGMSCEHCVKAVNNAIKNFAGTDQIKIDLKAGTADFTYDETQSSLTEIRAAIAEQGYEVK